MKNRSQKFFESAFPTEQEKRQHWRPKELELNEGDLDSHNRVNSFTNAFWTYHPNVRRLRENQAVFLFVEQAIKEYRKNPSSIDAIQSFVSNDPRPDEIANVVEGVMRKVRTTVERTAHYRESLDDDDWDDDWDDDDDDDWDDDGKDEATDEIRQLTDRINRLRAEKERSKVSRPSIDRQIDILAARRSALRKKEYQNESGNIRLREWGEKYGKTNLINFIPGGLASIPDVLTGPMRRELWDLSDYKVTGVTGGSIWLRHVGSST